MIILIVNMYTHICYEKEKRINTENPFYIQAMQDFENI